LATHLLFKLDNLNLNPKNPGKMSVIIIIKNAKVYYFITKVKYSSMPRPKDRSIQRLNPDVQSWGSSTLPLIYLAALCLILEWIELTDHQPGVQGTKVHIFVYLSK